MKVDGEVVPLAAQSPNQRQIGAESPWRARTGGDNHFVEMQIASNDGRRLFLDDVRDFGVRVAPPDCANGRRRKDNVANQPQADQQYVQIESLISNHPVYFSMTASSINITGMSSLIGYTRWHVLHFSPAPLCTSTTGVLQLGHARISRSSASSAMEFSLQQE
jgi:hypothetical protein